MVRLTAFLSASVVGLTAALTKDQLVEFTVNTLDGSRGEADDMAHRHIKQVNAARVSIERLKALHDVMLHELGMSVGEIKGQLFSLAKDGVDPEMMKHWYKILHDEMKAGEYYANDWTFTLAGSPIGYAPVKQIWEFVRNIIPDPAMAEHSITKRMAVEFVGEGLDIKALEDAWKATKAAEKDGQVIPEINSHGPPEWEDYLRYASTVALAKSTMLARYTTDGNLYTAQQYQQHYGYQPWEHKWMFSPAEKRVANDGKEYSAQEFQKIYGTDAESYWKQAPEAPQRRMTKDGQIYTLREFISHYEADKWQSEFQQSSIVADECAALNQEACDSLVHACQWKWTGEETDSCVLKSSTVAFLV
mmetsp:Transcript_33289/g.71350  ORF Transcript_33289/g.71350 Transcript_33289/m.71350 type:complete len:361 (+) Transcript_33289:185-1267(+)|eukprot:CAMPEP_0206444712 /NCGR_PEP_ID=MMETSP0324_2-20121206/15071_1 /ASSEMBLY_ACC=CAM_ASM_000836 /TAXON_ID=2866 /ORGANISM="Crypthecodinium cohnii, Strain Seligo" /LENGTH=360 /DNA_ID=CAMNT_0053912779 /DNA_START=103 /DNA_END=1185 /DNA_ORIENTATION=+